ncbi:DUF3846 domain-containing protein [Aminicella lysinilytica]|uniref:Uncharacterized protein DUF4314 n=1 Tax=Aminicella lysinilytica TaxID=433323 RepID=A0A4R6Q2D4_9FIRM|nr:DUF3846 domain-containing protein [Aminicella lysinilytica]TDP56394.1 uncharacterized protein DUF4314 [Aminicella lysinilytica]
MNVEQIKETYTEGMTIVLEEMKGEKTMPDGLRGTVKFVDDVGQIHMNWENGSSLALNIEEDKFFTMEEKKMISVILVEPGKYPKKIDIEDSLEAMQEVVGGYIEEYMPFDDDVAIVCNEKGKMNGAELNRAVYDKDGELMDIVAGKFFLCYAPIESETFQSLPKDMENKYREKFRFPERFFKQNDEIKVVPYKPINKEMER